MELFKSVLPDIFDIVHQINARFCGELMHKHDPRIGDGWLTDLNRLAGLKSHVSDEGVNAFLAVKAEKKRQLTAIRNTKNALSFGRKCLINVASAGRFSSDRTIREYAEEIWHIEPIQ